MDAPTIELNGCSATLEKPRATRVLALLPPPGVMHEGIVANSLSCFILAECWPKDRKWPGRIRPRPYNGEGKLWEHGEGILNDLIDAGCSIGDVFEAARDATNWAISTLPTQKETAQAEGFSEAPTGG
jgi:hypothetical protein